MPYARAIVFSKDRPLQLDGLLRSLVVQVTDVSRLDVVVLWTVSSDEFEQRYEDLMEDWPSVHFVRETSFYGQLMDLITDSSAPLIGFLVDDGLAVNPINLEWAWRALELQDQVVGFSLRLGPNLEKTNQPIERQWWQMDQQNAHVVDPVESIVPFTLCYPWAKAQGAFNYRLEVSASLYRRSSLLDWLPKLGGIDHPNSLENQMVFMPPEYVQHQPLLCMFERGAVLACPLNRVQSRAMRNEFSDMDTGLLSRVWDQGYRIDASVYNRYEYSSTHELLPLILSHQESGRRLFLMPHVIKSS